jgi:hypothetical protein
MPAKITTKSQTVAADIAALLRARNSLWIVTREEARAEGFLIEAAAAAGYITRTWDVASGACEIDGSEANLGLDPSELKDPGTMLGAIKDRAQNGKERCVWIMRDLPVWFEGMPGAATQRGLRNLARLLPGIPRESAQAVIILTPKGEVPAELADHVTVVEWPMPDRNEIASILDTAVSAIADPEKREAAAPNGAREAAIDAAVGLTGEEAASCYAKSLVQFKKIDPVAVVQEKKRVIARERVLEWIDPLAGGLDAVGGLDVLKGWLVSRKLAYSAAARAYGLPMPKGALIGGIPGTGKSLTAKAIATAWEVPLLRLDMGALKSKFVGESEQNLRKVFKVIEAIGRCVVWIDEIEKALQGATSGSADGGVSSDALGSLLSWMQDRKSEAFVIATANDVESLPAELLRKGRFDEVWWVDLPNASERTEIVKASLKYNGRKPVGDYAAVVDATEGFTGSEIAALVPEAMFAAFADGQREIIEQDLLNVAKSVVPLSKTAAARIEKLRAWAKGKARPATTPETEGARKKLVRALDM